MGTRRNRIEPRTHKEPSSARISCSKCGRVLMSSHEGIVGENNIAFCESCYKNLLFPNLRECYMEMLDESSKP
jgi:formylmethanofuran dehydrogenase subunit E